jgi:diguanylate cyclase (GGDEF)-like protein
VSPDGTQEPFDSESTASRGGRIRIRPVGKSKACLIMMTGAFPGETYVLEPNTELTIGRAPGSDIRIRTSDVSRVHAKVQSSASGRVEMIDLGSTNGTFVNGKRQLYRVLREGDKIQFGEKTVFRFAFHDEVDEEFQAKLLGAPFLDRITNTLTRERLTGILDVAHEEAVAASGDLSLLVMAVDGIDLLEDLLGYAVRDYFLRELSWIIRRAVAGEATLYRVGKSSFASLFPGLPLEPAVAAADRIRQVVSSARLTHQGDQMVFSLGVGVASLRPDGTTAGEGLLALAEQRCRKAAEEGGDRVEAVAG